MSTAIPAAANIPGSGVSTDNGQKHTGGDAGVACGIHPAGRGSSDIPAYSPPTAYLEEYLDRIRKLLRSGTWTNMGPEEETLRKALMQREQVRSVQPVSSGDMAIYTALLAIRGAGRKTGPEGGT